MKQLFSRINSRVWFVMLTLSAMAASASATTGVCGWSMP